MSLSALRLKSQALNPYPDAKSPQKISPETPPTNNCLSWPVVGLQLWLELESKAAVPHCLRAGRLV